jgi:alpha-methylacyl-CoA racemase
VIEMVGLGPCPFAAMMLADAGAEVIRVHRLGAVSDLPVFDTRFDVMARGRRSIALDLKRPEGLAALLRLVARADALIEGFRPGVMERLGLGPDACLGANPRLVYGRMTGWGQDGPLAQAAGHDIDYVALSGTLHAIGPADAPPVAPLNLLGDFGGGGMMLAFGVLAALHSARATGRGQVVDAAMTDGAALLAAMIWGFRAGGAWPGPRGANLLDGGAWYYGTYACADGRFVAVGPLEGRFRAAFLRILGQDPAEWAGDRPALWPERRARIAALFATRTRDDWAAAFAGSDACVAPVLDWDEAPAHPHNAARGTFVTVDGITQPGPAPRFLSTPAAPPAPPAAPGADTVAILSDWGFAADEVAALRMAGAIGAGPDGG